MADRTVDSDHDNAMPSQSEGPDASDNPTPGTPSATAHLGAPLESESTTPPLHETAETEIQ
ncbi:hypothetical protein LTR53_010757, partial [Teratosphaeriaceae sp. CCFEE 6253]